MQAMKFIRTSLFAQLFDQFLAGFMTNAADVRTGAVVFAARIVSPKFTRGLL